MKYLITGGAGFIGSHIASELVRRGEDVVIIDNLYTGKIGRLSSIMDKIMFVKGDIRDLGFLKKEFKGVDYVFHHAALISVTESMEKKDEYHDVNVIGTRNVLEAARINKVKLVTMASSCAVYGDAKVPMREDMEVKPISIYAINKHDDERLCKEYYEKHGLKTIIFRYFNVFGPGQDPSSPYAGVISIFIRKILNGETPTIYGDGKQTRDFVFVKNIVQANLLACKATSGFGEVYNIGSEHEVSVNNLVKLINKELKKKIRPDHAPERAGELRRALADSSKARKVLGFKPSVKFEEGLKDTIRWMKEGSKD
jgi:UDP-glucose 4-epimerase